MGRVLKGALWSINPAWNCDEIDLGFIDGQKICTILVISSLLFNFVESCKTKYKKKYFVKKDTWLTLSV